MAKQKLQSQQSESEAHRKELLSAQNKIKKLTKEKEDLELVLNSSPAVPSISTRRRLTTSQSFINKTSKVRSVLNIECSVYVNLKL